MVTWPRAFMTKELPSNTSSSCPPIKLTNSQRNAGLAHAPAHHFVLALTLLVDLVGRGVDHQQHLGPAPRAWPAGSGSQMSSHTSIPALMPFSSTTVGWVPGVK